MSVHSLSPGPKMPSRALSSAITDEYLIATTIPPHASFHAPDNRIPPVEFCALALPPLKNTPTGSDCDVSIYFSPDQPDSLEIDLLTVPVPLCAPEIMNTVISQWKVGSRSITLTVQGISHRLPLWLPDIWAPLIPTLLGHPKWTRSYEWYQINILSNTGPVHPELSHIATAIGLLFSVIGCNVRIRTPSATLSSLACRSPL